VRSERAFCAELDYQLLWRWFLECAKAKPYPCRGCDSLPAKV